MGPRSGSWRFLIAERTGSGNMVNGGSIELETRQAVSLEKHVAWQCKKTERCFIDSSMFIVLVNYKVKLEKNPFGHFREHVDPIL